MLVCVIKPRLGTETGGTEPASFCGFEIFQVPLALLAVPESFPLRSASWYYLFLGKNPLPIQ